MKPSTLIQEDENQVLWPYAPGEDLPQMFVFSFVEQDGCVDGVFWAEALGNMSIPFMVRLKPEQLERMAEWLKNWLVDDPRGFTEKGIEHVQRMIRDMVRCQAFIAQQQKTRKHWESNECDHLL